MRGRDPQTLLLRALTQMAEGAGVSIAIRSANSRAWHSATFSGERHVVIVEMPDSAEATSWLGALPEAEFAIRGHLVADMAVSGIRRADGVVAATLEALSLIDA